MKGLYKLFINTAIDNDIIGPSTSACVSITEPRLLIYIYIYMYVMKYKYNIYIRDRRSLMRHLSFPMTPHGSA